MFISTVDDDDVYYHKSKEKIKIQVTLVRPSLRFTLDAPLIQKLSRLRGIGRASGKDSGKLSVEELRKGRPKGDGARYCARVRNGQERVTQGGHGD